MKIVQIDWEDSNAISSWSHLSEAQSLRPVRILSVGHLIADEASYVTISQSVPTGEIADGQKGWDNVLSIPRSAIREIREVAMARKPTVSKAKAKEIMRHGTVRGEPLTKKQRGFFGARAGGAPVRRRRSR